MLHEVFNYFVMSIKTCRSVQINIFYIIQNETEIIYIFFLNFDPSPLSNLSQFSWDPAIENCQFSGKKLGYSPSL